MVRKTTEGHREKSNAPLCSLCPLWFIFFAMIHFIQNLLKSLWISPSYSLFYFSSKQRITLLSFGFHGESSLHLSVDILIYIYFLVRLLCIFEDFLYTCSISKQNFVVVCAGDTDSGLLGRKYYENWFRNENRAN